MYFTRKCGYAPIFFSICEKIQEEAGNYRAALVHAHGDLFPDEDGLALFPLQDQHGAQGENKQAEEEAQMQDWMSSNSMRMLQSSMRYLWTNQAVLMDNIV